LRGELFNGYFIYALIDPRDHVVRYIGITRNIYKRLTEHMDDPWGNEGKKEWITERKQLGLSAEIEIFEVIEAGPDARKVATEREEYWIQEYLRSGAPLLNIQGVTKRYPRAKKKLFARTSRNTVSIFEPAVSSFQDLLENMPATLTELARRSGVSEHSIMRMRDGERVNRSTANKVLSVVCGLGKSRLICGSASSRYSSI
jgi:hypothetical protein